MYKSKTFVRLGKELADMAFKNGFEGGALVASIPLLTDRQAKISTANEAILKLNQLTYLLNAMVKADLYEQSQTVKVYNYADQIVLALKEMLSKVTQPQRKITVKTPITVSQTAGTNVVATPTYEALPESAVGLDDGFDDVVYSQYPATYNQATAADVNK
jgi:hypothetical protein